MTAPIVFLDTETDGVHPDRQAWEVAMIRRDEAGETTKTMLLKIDMSKADPFGLKIGGFYDRHPDGIFVTKAESEALRKYGMEWPEIETAEYACAEIARMTHGATIVGAIPSFDAEVLGKLLRANGYLPAWSHRLVCVESLTAGHLGRLVGGLGKCAEALGIEVEEGQAHTALGDAKTALRIYDLIMGGAA